MLNKAEWPVLVDFVRRWPNFKREWPDLVTRAFLPNLY
jgi:hypothetical protein